MTNTVINHTMTSNIVVKIPFLDKISFVKNKLLGNTLEAWLVFFIILLGSIAVVFVFQKLIMKKFRFLAKKTDNQLDDFLILFVDHNLFPLLYFGALYFASRYLRLSQVIDKALIVIGVLLLTLFLIRFGTGIIRYWLEKIVMRREKNPEKLRTIQSLRPIINILVWTIGLIFLFSNLGFNISGLVAGLGISGIAIALAAQAILGDLFSYFSILLDRPFELGDFIIIDSYMGVVEHIGIKTTRLRSLSGEQLIFSNSNLTGSRVRNFKRMIERRVQFAIGVTYETPIAKLKAIPTILKEAVESQDKTRFDRAHFASYGDFALNFEIVYYVMAGDYNLYMDIQQAINFFIAEHFATLGINFAYPTQTLFVNTLDQKLARKQ